MDKPTTPGGPDPSQFPWSEDSGSESQFGATGVFGKVKASEPPPLPVVEAPKPSPPVYRSGEFPKTSLSPNALVEPVVHKVVLGGGAASTETSQVLLDRMRLAAAERAAEAEKAAAAHAAAQANAALSLEAGAKSSAGFTELLRTLGGESSASSAPKTPAPPAPRPMPAPEPPRPTSEPGGFTSMLRSLGTPQAAAPPAASPVQSAQPFAPVFSEEPKKAPPPPSSGGFTELLRADLVGSPEFGSSQPQRSGLAEPFASNRPATGSSASAENKPGAFTEMFSTFGGASAAPSAPPPPPFSPGGSAGGNAGSFTRMLSMEDQRAPERPSFEEENKPSAGVNYGMTPGVAGVPAPGAANRDPFAPAPLPDPIAPPSTPQEGVGITRLIRMLDEPTRTPSPRIESAPASSPTGVEPGAWTRTFGTLSDSPTPAAKAPEWTPPPPPPVAPVMSLPSAPASAGPSEFTRILDASRMREIAMKGGQAPGAAMPSQPPQPPAFSPALPPIAPPSYPMPAPPPMPGAQGFGAMPQPGGFPPPQPPHMPAYPMTPPSPGAFHAPGGGMPQAPGMYAPPPPTMPAMPPAPAVKPPEGAMGGMQKFVPLLLVLIIVLLVGLLVTVIFMMKH